MLIFYLCYLYLFTYTGVQHDFYIRWCSCYSTATRRVPLMKHLALSSPPIFSPIRVVQCQVFRVVFSISFCSFSSGYCIIYTSMIYNFWLSLWYLQTFFSIVDVIDGLNKYWAGCRELSDPTENKRFTLITVFDLLYNKCRTNC